jgi:hypothetical protein
MTRSRGGVVVAGRIGIKLKHIVKIRCAGVDWFQIA